MYIYRLMYNTFTSISREDHQRSPLIAFHNVGLSGNAGINSKNWSMETLTSVREKLNIQNVSDQLVYLFVYRYKTLNFVSFVISNLIFILITFILFPVSFHRSDLKLELI